MENSTSKPSNRPQQRRNETGVSYHISKHDESWSFERDLTHLSGSSRQFSPRKISRRATMPLPGPKKTETQRTVASSTFSFIPTSPKSAINGLSVWDKFVGYLASKTNALAIGPPPTPEVIDSNQVTQKRSKFLPDIEVRSKRRNAFGVRKWKEMVGLLDTGCFAGNWVSLATLKKLGIERYLELNEFEIQGAQTVSGAVITACGAVNLSWRFVSSQGLGQNGARNYKMRFLVMDTHPTPAPFEILIGNDSIEEYNLLVPTYMMLRRKGNRILQLPREVQVSNSKRPTAEERAAHEKEKEEIEKQEAAEKAAKRAARRAAAQPVPVVSEETSPHTPAQGAAANTQPSAHGKDAAQTTGDDNNGDPKLPRAPSAKIRSSRAGP